MVKLPLSVWSDRNTLSSKKAPGQQKNSTQHLDQSAQVYLVYFVCLLHSKRGWRYWWFWNFINISGGNRLLAKSQVRPKRVQMQFSIWKCLKCNVNISLELVVRIIHCCSFSLVFLYISEPWIAGKWNGWWLERLFVSAAGCFVFWMISTLLQPRSYRG